MEKKESASHLITHLKDAHLPEEYKRALFRKAAGKSFIENFADPFTLIGVATAADSMFRIGKILLDSHHIDKEQLSHHIFNATFELGAAALLFCWSNDEQKAYFVEQYNQIDTPPTQFKELPYEARDNAIVKMNAWDALAGLVVGVATNKALYSETLQEHVPKFKEFATSLDQTPILKEYGIPTAIGIGAAVLTHQIISPKIEQRAMEDYSDKLSEMRFMKHICEERTQRQTEEVSR